MQIRDLKYASIMGVWLKYLLKFLPMTLLVLLRLYVVNLHSTLN